MHQTLQKLRKKLKKAVRTKEAPGRTACPSRIYRQHPWKEARKELPRLEVRTRAHLDYFCRSVVYQAEDIRFRLWDF